nr:methyltransferase [Cohnella sp. WQ 127256]
MSHLRHNILNWFPFKDNCSILEIGAGCGALTGLLCERAQRVVAVELTKRRAEVNYERHRHYNNLEIVVCDFQKIPSKWKFDYVIVNGVLEYAAYMLDGKQPYEDFLRISAEHMNPNGRMLLSIENRLGLKYFAGAKEDHTGKYFSGLNGYIDGERVRTFSQEELCDEINKADLNALKFYYPYPDYKFPAEIYTDSTINEMMPTVPNYPLDMSRTKLFEERSMYRSLMKLGVMDKFSNSFLVEIASAQDELPTEMAYIKLSANRNERFRIATYFKENENKVHKQSLCSQAEDHLTYMERFSAFDYGFSRILNIESQEEEVGHLTFPFIAEENFEDTLLAAYNSGNIDEGVLRILEVRDTLFADIQLQKQPDSEEFRNVFGETYCLKELRWTDNANVDMISGNMFLIDNQYHVIDYEWHVPCKVPQEFVMWRMLKQFIDDHDLGEIITKSMRHSIINIDEQTEKCFYEWESHFARKYVGIRDLFELSQETVPIDIEQAVIQQTKEKVLESTLFFDLGNGFTDSDYERCYAKYSETGFIATFTQEKLSNAKLLRWDPLEGNACFIKIQKIETDGLISDVVAINAERYSDELGYEFFTFDPQLNITGDFSNATYLKVWFTCHILDWTQGYRRREEEISLLRHNNEEQAAVNQQLLEQNDMLRLEIETKQNELQDVQHELNSAQIELQNTQGNLQDIVTELNDHRIKSMVKVMIYGGIIRRKSDE